MEYDTDLGQVPDDELLHRLASLLGNSRVLEAELVAHIGEVDARRLYAREASPSMFTYCTEALHLSEAEAYLRITAARAAREHPVILEMLGDGRLHLSGIAKLVPHLTLANAPVVLARAAHRSKRQIEELVAELAPRPDVPTVVRKRPGRPTLSIAPEGVPSPDSQPRPGMEVRPNRQLRPDGAGSSVASTPSPGIEPLAPARYKVQFTASLELRDKLERLQKLMQVPGGDLADVIERIVTEKLEQLEKRRFGMTKTPGTRPEQRAPVATRYIPAAVRRAVYVRDGGRCRYTDTQGRRCSERHRLEYHHRYPYGFGGDGAVANISLLCPAHNRYEAGRDYGRTTMARHRSSRIASKRGSA